VWGNGRTDFLEAHSYIIIATEYKVLVYEIFSVFITNIQFNYTKIYFEHNEFEELVRELNHRSVFNTQVTASAKDNLLLLSTCDNANRHLRIVVASRLAQKFQIPK
jgi:sortase B